MGEYAEDYFRREVQSKYGFDPGTEKEGKKQKVASKVQCKTCGKHVKAAGLTDHMRDAHGVSK